ncbi:hypothetical protein ILYODFUR_031313 [Ilyodon furcidens]|uniref:Uncharacterized protein n=1 Tax=Ilyodon furcidens TaxID=33524 RepID=A0ABV0U9Z7_9TELE
MGKHRRSNHFDNTLLALVQMQCHTGGGGIRWLLYLLSRRMRGRGGHRVEILVPGSPLPMDQTVYNRDSFTEFTKGKTIFLQVETPHNFLDFLGHLLGFCYPFIH